MSPDQQTQKFRANITEFITSGKYENSLIKTDITKYTKNPDLRRQPSSSILSKGGGRGGGKIVSERVFLREFERSNGPLLSFARTDDARDKFHFCLRSGEDNHVQEFKNHQRKDEFKVDKNLHSPPYRR
jgi:hypothetical protein